MRRALAVLLLVSLSAFAKEKDKDKERTKARWGPFVAYDGARKLCQEHVIGSTLHISWQSYATADPVGMVVAFYEKELGKKAEVGAAISPFTARVPTT